MELGFTIVYVDHVEAVVSRFEAAFGLVRRWVTEDGLYGELETGQTTLAFANRAFGRAHFDDAVAAPLFDGPPARFELGLVTADVLGAYERAIEAGMIPVVAPVLRPWGQLVGWVRDPEGVLVELSSPAPE